MSTDIVYWLSCKIDSLKEKFDNNERIFVATVKDVKNTQNAAWKDTFIYTLDVLENIKWSTNDGNFESIINPLSYWGRISNFEYRDWIPTSFPIGSTYIIFDSHSFFFFERKGFWLYWDSCPSNKGPLETSLKDSNYRDLKLIKQRSINPDWQWFYAIEEKIKPLLQIDYSIKNAAQRNIIFWQRNHQRETGKKKWYDMFVPCHEMTLSDNECSTLWNNRCASYVSWTITLYWNWVWYQSSDQCRELSKKEREMKEREKILCEQTNGRWMMWFGCSCSTAISLFESSFQSLQDEFYNRQKNFSNWLRRDDQLWCIEWVKACTEAWWKWIRDIYTEKHIPQAKTIEECIQLSIPNDWMQKWIDKNYKAYKSWTFSGYIFRFAQYENGAVNNDKLQYRNSDQKKCYERMYEHDGEACTGVEKFKHRS